MDLDDRSFVDKFTKSYSISKPYQNYDSRGNPSSFGVDLELPELGLFKSLKSTDSHVLSCKIESTLLGWAKKYHSHLESLHQAKVTSDVDALNNGAKEALDALHGLLAHTLVVDDAVDWDSVKRKDEFHIGPDDLFDEGGAPEYFTFEKGGKPVSFDRIAPPEEPTQANVRARYGVFSRIFRGKAILKDFEKRQADWKKAIEDCAGQDKKREENFKVALDRYAEEKGAFERKRHEDNEALEQARKRYLQSDPNAIEEYCDLVLTSSQYPDCIPRNWELEYHPESRLVVVDFELPIPDMLPSSESFKYVKARDEVVEKKLSAAAQKKLYDSVIYQICVRTLHELFEADKVDGIASVAFNGVVSARSKATGVMERKVILSVVANKEEFVAFDLAEVDPKATFRHLKGVSASSLYELTPIAPVMKLQKTDKRFIEGRKIEVDDSVNIAAMDWKDFEHLIRELFEKEFATNGGEVRVTQASADGGVDAVAFDPDPLRGGKIVIQAKRYVNTVGVAAVRDLYGTVMNEGATKGILVTTSDFGDDSYRFAQDKPLTLINGSNLLALLEKHGHSARINTAEAKKMLHSEAG